MRLNSKQIVRLPHSKESCIKIEVGYKKKECGFSDDRHENPVALSRSRSTCTCRSNLKVRSIEIKNTTSMSNQLNYV